MRLITLDGWLLVAGSLDEQPAAVTSAAVSATMVIARKCLSMRSLTFGRTVEVVVGGIGGLLGKLAKTGVGDPAPVRGRC